VPQAQAARLNRDGFTGQRTRKADVHDGSRMCDKPCGRRSVCDTIPAVTTTRDWDAFNAGVVEDFRAHQGTITAGRFAGRQRLVFSATGAKSGKQRVAPLAFTRDGEHYVVIASKGGSPTSPDWYHNLVANPRVTVEIGSERFEAIARVTSGAERERLFAAQAALMPGFAEYQKQTTRSIPVVVLERVKG
jgi:deazaflavin-dependent oxidoreductase (nitroreductase family)